MNLVDTKSRHIQPHIVQSLHMVYIIAQYIMNDTVLCLFMWVYWRSTRRKCRNVIHLSIRKISNSERGTGQREWHEILMKPLSISVLWCFDITDINTQVDIQKFRFFVSYKLLDTYFSRRFIWLPGRTMIWYDFSILCCFHYQWKSKKNTFQFLLQFLNELDAFPAQVHLQF